MIFVLTIILYSAFGYTFELKDYFLLGSLLLNIILLVVFYRLFIYKRTQFVKISIRRNNKDLPEYQIRIRNTGIVPIELDPPVVIFKKKGSKRLFQVRTGNVNGFPVSLFKKEEYDFIVDLARFYATDSTLITYNKVFLEVRNSSQAKLANKRLRITRI